MIALTIVGIVKETQLSKSEWRLLWRTGLHRVVDQRVRLPSRTTLRDEINLNASNRDALKVETDILYELRASESSDKWQSARGQEPIVLAMNLLLPTQS